MNAIVRTALASALLPAAAVFAANQPPVISNVRASQRADTKLVDIYYDASDADGDLLKVRVEISDNDGTTYSIPAFTLSGDVGEGVATGTDKHIVWDAGTDWDGEYSDKMRVKVIAIDAKGFPNMEWGNEIPPGGFLLGQDGGEEGSGPSRHVNVAWSYWMSKYEITNRQYCEFLNAAYATGIVTQQNSSVVASTALMPVSYGCGVNVTLCNIGDDRGLRWNVNNFEAVEGREDWPVCVTWYGAMAFCRFYGYDLPTEAEWEKAARGPDHDDQDEHLLYPWGDEWSDAYANGTSMSYSSTGAYANLKSVGTYNGNQTPVGPDTINGYGLYDVIGNAAEWTRTLYGSTIETYPTNESLADDRNSPYSSGTRVVKGVKEGLYVRTEFAPEKDSCNVYRGASFATGFRVVRREDGVADVSLRLAVKEDFETWATRDAIGTTVYTSNGYSWIVGIQNSIEDNVAFSGKIAVYDKSGGSWGSTDIGVYAYYLFLPELTEQIGEVRMRIRNDEASSSREVILYSGESANYDTTGCLNTKITVPALTDFELFSIRPVCNGKRNFLSFRYLYLDDIEIYTIVKP